jgi:hypothetical protein
MNGKRRILIILKGTVGAGKSTYAGELQRQIEAKGWTCLSEGTDKYSRIGSTNKQASDKVHQALSQSKKITNNLVIIIDTCGERTNSSTIFGYCFTGWETHTLWPNYRCDFDEQMQLKYLKWSLSNVLNRPSYSPSSNYYLNPESVSLSLCIKIHRDKFKRLIGNCPTVCTSNLDKNIILAELKPTYDEFTDWLSTNMDLTQTVSEFLDQIL